MAGSLYSHSWYRAAGLKPRLRGHVQIHRHHYRGELWYVLQDHLSGRFQRFTPVAYQIIGMMDGQRSVQEIWNMACARLGADAPTQDDMIRLLTQLHMADALQSDVIPDTRELMKRYHKQRFGKWKQNLRSPLFMRLPLLDPERFLARFQSVVQPAFSWIGFVIWLIVVGFGIFLAGVHWSELTLNTTDRILSPGNLVVMWLTFPILKAFHEFAHAFALKIKGGEVHEIGFMMLVFTPIPYVDASSASSFREKRDRIIVGGAGLAIEIFIAALALFAWINMQPGPIRSLTYNIIFIAGVSSIFFNGNPLLRYDAYYILSDFLEIPNLATRGNQYLAYLFKRYVLSIKETEPLITSQGERFWLVFYAISSFIYRVFVYAAIIIFIASKFFFIGVLFACWGLFNMFLIPVFKGIKFLLTSPQLVRHRTRSVLIASSLIVFLITMVGIFPLPLNTVTEGVMWLPETSFVRAGTDGFVEKVLAEPGKMVKTGDPLIKCSDPLLPAQISLLMSQKKELEVRYNTEMFYDKVKAEITKEEIAHSAARLADARERLNELTLYSDTEGIFLLPMAQDLPSSFVRRGQLLGYVVNQSKITVRVVVSQADVDIVRQKTMAVDVRFPENLSAKLPAILKREVPAATDQIPARVLGKEGGGEIAVDPRDSMGNKAFQKIFLFDIELPLQDGIYRVGGRVHVRFDHGMQPVIFRWYRGLRQLFLRRFNV